MNSVRRVPYHAPARLPNPLSFEVKYHAVIRKIHMSRAKKYDVAFSFAGEQRQFVNDVVAALSRQSISVFCDDSAAQISLWGKDLSVELDRVYRLDSKCVVVIVSKEYVQKEWTRREIRSALAAALTAPEPYVLPARFDDADLVGLPPTTVFIDLRKETPATFAQKILAKLAYHTVDDQPVKDSFTVIFDEPIKTWLRTPPNTNGYSNALKLLPELSTVVTNKNGYSTPASLQNASILILPTPRDTTISEQEVNVISEWVYQGGGLLVMGFYLAEAHHGNNINSLVHRFGMEFKDDLIMPIERFRNQPLGMKIEPGMELFRYCMGQAFDVNGRDSCVLSQPDGIPASHPLLESVSKLALTSCCTVECAVDAEVVVCTSDPVAMLHAVGIKDNSRRLARIDRYVLDHCAPGQFMVAVKYGAGKVVAIGTWKMFLNELVKSDDNRNGILFGNIVDWLRTK